MYRLLSAHVLALIDDSVISIERYIAVLRGHLPPCLPSSDPVSQCGDLNCGHLGQLCSSLTKCLLLEIRIWPWTGTFIIHYNNDKEIYFFFSLEELIYCIYFCYIWTEGHTCGYKLVEEVSPLLQKMTKDAHLNVETKHLRCVIIIFRN